MDVLWETFQAKILISVQRKGAGQTSWLEAESVKLWSAQLVKRK